MRPGPASAAKIILETTALDATPKRVKELIALICLNQDWCDSKDLAAEKGEAWAQACINKLRQDLSVLQEHGRPARVTFNSSSEDVIQGACFVEPRDGDIARDQKARRLRSAEYYSAFDKLSPDQFETLCAKFIGLLGVKSPIVTRRSADEGIDFYGRLSLGSMFFPHDLTPTIQSQLSIWLIGQAKHYKSIQSGTPEIRDLAGAIALGRAGAFGGNQSPFGESKIMIAEPVFSLFVTTGQISTNGWRLLRRSGIIGMDGDQLAAFLADRSAGLKDETDNFSEDLFFEWLAQ